MKGVEFTSRMTMNKAFNFMVSEIFTEFEEDIEKEVRETIKLELKSTDFKSMIKKEVTRIVRSRSNDMIRKIVREIFWDEDVKEAFRPAIQKTIVKTLEEIYDTK